MKKNIEFSIGKRKIGEQHPTLIVVDVAQSHDGSLGMAHAFIDAIANSGADAVKFQTHIAEAESTSEEPFRVKFSLQDKTRYDYWKRMEFTPNQWKGLADHAREKQLIFLSSPFSVEAAILLEDIGVPAWKIGSGEVQNEYLLEHLLRSDKPILISSGMSSWNELDATVTRILDAEVPCMIYQCTSLYPCPPEKVGLGLIDVMRRRYGVPVGLSDHSGMPCFGISAVVLGAASVEVHITMSRDSFGPDVIASLTPDDLCQMVQCIRAVESSMNAQYDKDLNAASLTEMKEIFGHGIVTRVPLCKGDIITIDKLTVKKPAKGLPPSHMKIVIGLRAASDLPQDHFLTLNDLE